MAGASRAAWVLAAGLLLWPLLPAPEPEPECARPAALASERVPTVAVRCGGGPPLRGAARLLFDQRLDANRADAASLETLPGIGPVRAAAIVALLRDDALRARQQERAAAVLPSFTWQRAARETLAVLEATARADR